MQNKAKRKRVLSSEEKPFKIEPTFTGDKEEQRPWTLYVQEKSASLDGYPEYIYLEYSLYIYNVIQLPEYYSEVFHIIRNASAGDVLHIFINSPGGAVDTLSSFSAAIDDTEALVVCHVDGSADSAAFVLAFMGDETFFAESSQLMAHNQRLSIGMTDMANLNKFLQNATTTYRNMLERYCYKVLSPEEIEKICTDGQEIHLTSAECRARIKAYKEAHPEEYSSDDEEDSTAECDCCGKLQ